MNDQRRTPFEATSDNRAMEMYRRNPEEALRASRLTSAESDPVNDRSLAIMRLAEEEPERFMELVSYLPHAIQDIFYQYYLLGRTQEQIGALVGIPDQANLSKVLITGVEGLCAIIAYGQPPQCQPGTEMERAYQRMLAFRTRPESRGELVVETPRKLGMFEISAGDVELVMETFAASWSVYGPRSAGG